MLIIFSSSPRIKNVKRGQSVRMSRNKQLFSILLATNGLFVCLVSPLVILNAIGQASENSVTASIAYILAYSNHAYENFRIKKFLFKE